VINDSQGNELPAAARISLHPDVDIRASLLLGQLQVRRMALPEFWRDPLGHEDLMDPGPAYHDCLRFYFNSHPNDVEVPFLDKSENGSKLNEMLRSPGLTYGDLQDRVSASQRSLVGRLHNAGMLVIEAA